MKATAIAPANIAFIKYWGRVDDALTLPANSSLSMNLSECLTTTTVEFSPQREEDDITVAFYGEDPESLEGSKKDRIVRQLDRIRSLAGSHVHAKVVSKNSFPEGVGVASSASAFAALTVAAARAIGLSLSEKELTILARLSGSGSACRSIPDGIVLWEKGVDHDTSSAYSLFPPNHWNLVDIVCLVSKKEKTVGSREGHAGAWTSPYYRLRLQKLPKRTQKITTALAEKNLSAFGPILEEEAVDLHLITMSQKPPLFYWLGKTIDLIHAVQQWRMEGCEAYFTFDAGSCVHILCQQQTKEEVVKRLHQFDEKMQLIINTPAQGTRLTDTHLF